MDSFSSQTQGYYLSLEDAEFLTNRRLPHLLLGSSTSSLEVYEEELKGQLVAVKRFRTNEHVQPLLGNIMRALGRWRRVSEHPNIMPFLGLCSEDMNPLPILLTPRARWNLLEYIKTHPDAPKHALVYSIAAALEYMHSQVVPITHGNIKAGNVLVDRDGIAYLSDVGIFQAVMPDPGPLALVDELRWSAPEKVLYQAAHTCACDTWSFGMMVIEMHTGVRPYDYYNLDSARTAISIGEKPYCPSNMAKNLSDLVECCLKYAAVDRPSMQWVSSMLTIIP